MLEVGSIELLEALVGIAVRSELKVPDLGRNISSGPDMDHLHPLLQSGHLSTYKPSSVAYNAQLYHLAV